MAILSSTGIAGFLSSAKATGKQILNKAGKLVPEFIEYFVPGFVGHGWKIWEYVKGKWKLEIDTIVVRETMVVFELLIQKIRAVKGALNITQASGKIKTAVLDASKQNWLITIEDEMSFVAHDIIRCQDWTNSRIKGYWVEISEIRKIEGADTIVIPVSEFTGGIGYIDGMETVKTDLNSMTTPAPGDEIVQFGNSVNVNRQSAIYIHADEGGQPAIDILFGIKSKSFAGCVKQRIGGDIPGSGGLKGFYCENGMIKGVDDTGHVVYCIHPNGSAEFGDGSAQFLKDKSGHIAGGAISWEWNEERQKFVCTMKGVVLTWANLDDEAKDNLKGEKGGTGDTGADGVNGKDGVSMVFKGNLATPPANPQNGWYYKNTSDKKSYVYQDGTWYQMTIDGVDGKNGKDGLDITWKGESATPPANPQKNWVYRDTDNGLVYIYNGTAWALMVSDGSDGANGADGVNGWSVFITYHDNESQPDTPTGNGTSGGWHTAPNTKCVWMSQKVADDASSGSWGTPIRIKGATGPQGVPGAPGADGKVLFTWIRYADSDTGSGISNNPTGKLYIGLAYNKDTQVESNTPSDYMWSLIKGTDGADGSPGKDGKNGTDGVPGAPGADGKTTYTWIAYSDNADGTGMYQVPKSSTKYIGIAINKSTAIESNVPSHYTWSLFKGEDAIVYSIEFEHDGKVIHSIPAFADGVPKNHIAVTAKLYRIVGGDKVLCSDYYFSLIITSAAGKKYATYDFTPSSQTSFTTSDGIVSYAISVSPESSPYPTDIICSSTINIVCDGQQGEDAEVPDWLKDWDGFATEIGSEYIVTPSLFSGTKNPETGALTGVAQGRNCITIGNEKHSGLFGLKDNKLTFEIDALTGDAVFRGKLETAKENTRVVIDPLSNPQQGVYPGMTIYDINGELAATFNGASITSINDLYGSSGLKEYAVTPESHTLQGITEPMLDTIDRTLVSFTAATSGVISIPKIEFFVSIDAVDTQPHMYAFVISSVFVNGVLVAENVSGLKGENTLVDSKEFNSIKIPVSKGACTVVYRVEFRIEQPSKGHVDIHTTLCMPNKVLFSDDMYMSRYFANGFALGSTVTNFFECLNVNRSMILRAMMSDYGFNFTEKGVQLKLSGKWYTLSVDGGVLKASESTLLD